MSMDSYSTEVDSADAEELRLAAKRGYALLCEHKPEWLAKARVNPRGLVMYDSCLCVLGVGQGDFYKAQAQLKTEVPESVQEAGGLLPDWADYFGFDVPIAYDDKVQHERYDVLAEAWTELLA